MRKLIACFDSVQEEGKLVRQVSYSWSREEYLGRRGEACRLSLGTFLLDGGEGWKASASQKRAKCYTVRRSLQCKYRNASTRVSGICCTMHTRIFLLTPGFVSYTVVRLGRVVDKKIIDRWRNGTRCGR